MSLKVELYENKKKRVFPLMQFSVIYFYFFMYIKTDTKYLMTFVIITSISRLDDIVLPVCHACAETFRTRLLFAAVQIVRITLF